MGKRLRCDEIFNNHFIAHLMLSVPVSHAAFLGQQIGGLLFRPLCICNLLYLHSVMQGFGLKTTVLVSRPNYYGLGLECLWSWSCSCS